MNSSIFKVFCLYKRIDYIFYKDNFEMIYTIDDPLQKSWFDRSPKYIRQQCERIFNEIESHHYTYHDMTAILIYKSLWDSSLNFKWVNHTDIDEFKQIFTDIQLAKDFQILKATQKKLKMKHWYDYFLVDETGKSLIYSLTIAKAISVWFYMSKIEQCLTEPTIVYYFMNRGKAYRKFEATLKILKNYI
jgi:hypothetical protein